MDHAEAAVNRTGGMLEQPVCPFSFQLDIVVD
jgi:hypothetical protein